MTVLDKSLTGGQLSVHPTEGSVSQNTNPERLIWVWKRQMQLLNGSDDDVSFLGLINDNIPEGLY